MASTEIASKAYRTIDTWSPQDICAAIAAQQTAALAAVTAALPAIARAAEAIAGKVAAGGRLIYVGAGSSGLLAQVDALEMPGTYGLDSERVAVLLAGGPAALLDIPSGDEDDEAQAEASVAALAVGPGDAVMALSVSGRTPYAVAALRQARGRGALAVGFACNAGTPLLIEADHAILVETPPEVIAGSTRMGAGTAQKCVLNMVSTLLGIRLGHGYGGLMVNMRPDNAKLKHRAVAIVAEAAGVEPARAAEALALGHDIKTAILLCRGAPDKGTARAVLEAERGDVRAAIARLS